MKKDHREPKTKEISENKRLDNSAIANQHIKLMEVYLISKRS